MPFASINTDTDRGGNNRPQLENPPPRPPRQGRSMMEMATDNSQLDQGMGMNSKPVQAMQKFGDLRKDAIDLGMLLPQISQGLQQFVQALEQIVPQQVADMISGLPPGGGGSSMGTGMGAGPAAPQAASAPTAPPVATGMP